MKKHGSLRPFDEPVFEPFLCPRSDDSEMIMTIAQMATGHNASDAALIMQLSNQSGLSPGASANAASEANSLSHSMNQDLMDWVASLRPARFEAEK